MGGYKMIILAFLVNGVFGADSDEVSVNEGESVTLNSGVIKKKDEIMQWYCNNILIVHINGDPEKICFYYGEGGIFRDRLKVDYKTGSLNITNIRSEHAGRYEAEHIKSDSSGTGEIFNTKSKCDSTKNIRKTSEDEIIKTFSVNVTAPGKAPGKAEPQMDIKEQETDKTVPGSGLSSGVVAGIVVAVLLGFAAAAAVGVIYSLRSKSRKRDEEIRKPELLPKVEV